MLRRLLALLAITIGLIATLVPTSTTTASASAFTYDAPAVARADVHEFGRTDARTAQVTSVWERSASPPMEARGTVTTLLTLSNATEAVPGASNTANGARLNEQLRLTERYGAGGVRELSDGRLRFYGEVTPAKTPGEMAGARLVREWDPATGLQRTWYETLDQAGNVRIVRPETGGPKIHHTFGPDGSYAGPR
jgi:hypothetical protein